MRKVKVNRKAWYKFLDANPVNVNGQWHNEMIRCPSQCYLELECRGKKFTIYLRWRHDDPWTCDLIGASYFKFTWRNEGRWYAIPVGYYTEDEISQLKRKAFSVCARLIRMSSPITLTWNCQKFLQYVDLEKYEHPF